MKLNYKYKKIKNNSQQELPFYKQEVNNYAEAFEEWMRQEEKKSAIPTNNN